MTQTKWAQTHKTRVLEINRKSYQKRKKKILSWHKDYYKKNSEKKKEYSREYEKKNRDLLNRKMQTKKAQYRLDALRYYGGNPPKCKKCGFNQIEALVIDHIKNDGNKHRKEINRRDVPWWLRSNKYPKGFQVLCCNCNWIKYIKNKKSTILIKKLSKIYEYTR